MPDPPGGECPAAPGRDSCDALQFCHGAHSGAQPGAQHPQGVFLGGQAQQRHPGKPGELLYLGLVAGVALVELGGRALPDSEFFVRPGVDLPVAVSATLVLITAGALAGLVPALRAARIQPVEALKDE